VWVRPPESQAETACMNISRQMNDEDIQCSIGDLLPENFEQHAYRTLYQVHTLISKINTAKYTAKKHII